MGNIYLVVQWYGIQIPFQMVKTRPFSQQFNRHLITGLVSNAPYHLNTKTQYVYYSNVSGIEVSCFRIPTVLLFKS